MSENEKINEKGPIEVVTGKINPQTIGGWREGEGDTPLPPIESVDEESETSQ